MHALGPRSSVALVATLAACPVLAGCGDDDRREVRLARVAPAEAGDCGLATDGRAVRVAALGDFAVSEATARFVPADGPDVVIDQFPPDTRVFEVTVLGPGAVPRTTGRSAVVALDDLPDGSAVPILMAPPRGLCPTGSMTAARRNPLVARAGPGVLVAGGIDTDGEAVASVELYRPATGDFVEVSDRTYASGPQGLVGASLTELDDGRVALAGGTDQAFALFDPGPAAFSSALFLPTRRAFHAAAPLPDGRLLLAGGCGDVDTSGACEPGTALADTAIVDVDTGEQTPGPALSGPRVGGRAIIEDDGRVLIVGGTDGAGAAVTRADRIDPIGGAASEGLAEVAGVPVRLASGLTLVAFGGDASAQVFSVPPGDAAGTQLGPPSTARPGVALAAVDDGAVLAVGGSTDGPLAALFEPVTGEFVPLDLAAAEDVPRVGLRAVRLDDGAVLLLGGSDSDGEAVRRAFVYRHDLTNEFSSRLQAVVADPALSFALSPSNPARVRRVNASADAPAHVRLEGADGLENRVDSYVVAGGPGFVDVALEARAAVDAGGLAVLFGFSSGQDYMAALLQAGAPAQIRRVAGGQSEQVCSGGPTVEVANLVDAAVRVDVRADRARLFLGADELLDCDLGDAAPRGLVGAGVFGDADAVVRLERLTADR